MAHNRDDYSRFDPTYYLRTRYTHPEEGRNPWILQCFHDFVQHYKSRWDPKTARFLEIGGGPSIMLLISVTPHVSEIVFSDYAEENCREVERWRTACSDAHDWTPFMKFVVNNLEGDSDQDSATARENLMRGRVRVISCDILADGGIFEDEAATSVKYDIITTSGCIEAVVHSVSQYRDCLVKLRDLLKPGGLLVGMVYLESAWWEVVGERYHGFPISETTFVRLLQEAGFVLLERRLMASTVKGHSHSDVKGVLFYVAKTHSNC